MSGRAGRSGRPPKPIADHIRDHTYRRDRHDARLAEVIAMTTPNPEVERWTRELRIEADQARGELRQWRRRAKERPDDFRIARRVAME